MVCIRFILKKSVSERKGIDHVEYICSLSKRKQIFFSSPLQFGLLNFPLNTPLVYLDRKGMVLNEYKMKDKALVDQWFRINKPDLIMIPVQWKDKIKTDRPDIEQRMKLEYSGKDVMTYRYLGE